MGRIRTDAYLQELNAEHRASRRCLERIPEHLFGYKPHAKSMDMGYLALLVAQIPLWIRYMVIEGEIDLASLQRPSPETNTELVRYLEDNINGARQALEKTSDEDLQGLFTLKARGQVLYQAPRIVDIGVTLNHWVHHRGQLTVYMRLNDIAVPAIYGPSAGDRNVNPG